VYENITVRLSRQSSPLTRVYIKRPAARKSKKLQATPTRWIDPPVIDEPVPSKRLTVGVGDVIGVGLDFGTDVGVEVGAGDG
jgi:hypothetical protein